jgi:hypothetical protein
MPRPVPSSAARGQAEHDHRDRNAGFDEGNADPHDAERTPRRHDRDEGQRHRPERAAAEIGREHAHRDHRQHMVDAGHRMHEAMDEAGGRAGPDMSPGGSGRQDRAEHGDSA